MRTSIHERRRVSISKASPGMSLNCAGLRARSIRAASIAFSSQAWELDVRDHARTRDVGQANHFSKASKRLAKARGEHEPGERQKPRKLVRKKTIAPRAVLLHKDSHNPYKHAQPRHARLLGKIVVAVVSSGWSKPQKRPQRRVLRAGAPRPAAQISAWSAQGAARRSVLQAPFSCHSPFTTPAAYYYQLQEASMDASGSGTTPPLTSTGKAAEVTVASGRSIIPVVSPDSVYLP
jgi:hypothetical protein